MRTRKSFDALGATDRDLFLQGVLTLKNTVVDGLNVYDRFVALHAAVMRVVTPPNNVVVNMGHLEAGFLPWHRQFIHAFEAAINTQLGTTDVAIPYWDWTHATQTETQLLADDFLSASPGGAIRTGYFAAEAPGSGNNPTAEPAWWPAGLAGFQIHPGLSQGLGTTLVRNPDHVGELAFASEVQATMQATTYEAFRRAVEGGPRMHNFGHNWVGGHMSNVLISPNDPIFFMHHANVDRLWHQWQTNGHQGAGFYPESGEPPGHNLNDAMWPWVGGAAGYASQLIPDWALPDVGQNAVARPVDVLDIAALDYEYT